MCGIAGFIDPAGRTSNPERVLRAMRDTLTHRGPDDAGEVFAPPAYLGHRRLTIVDLSTRGRQPFVVPGERPGTQVTALANGEIYNHAQLRPRIAQRFGSPDIAASDCAVLPWLWRLEGEAMADRLVGMYGLAVWDAANETLHLARDIAGQKPLYFARLPGGGIAFASEPKALLVHPLVGRDVDPIALRRYLAYDAVPGTATIYAGIERLAPATSVTWRRGELRYRTHFEVPYGEGDLDDRQGAAEALWEALGDAVEARLMADVPLGVFLSGGLDSTAVVAALAARVDPATIRTFAVGFSSQTFDESSHARRVAEYFGTEHHEQTLDPATMLELVPDILALLDEPFADPSIIPTYLLSRFARESVTVALGGDGGDELFLGYPTFYADRAARLAARVPTALRRATIGPLLDLVPSSTDYMSFEFKLRRFFSAIDQPAHHRHAAWIGSVHPREHAQALPATLLARAPDASVYADQDQLQAEFRRAAPDGEWLDQLAWQYFRTYLGGDVLTKVDRASMAHALEVRAPFLDPAVIRVAARIPPKLKLVGKTTKRVLRDMLVGRAPELNIGRVKQGFGVPVGEWLRGPLEGWMRSVLDPGKVARGGLLNPAWTSRLMGEHVRGVADHRKPLWAALVLELWRTGPYGPG